MSLRAILSFTRGLLIFCLLISFEALCMPSFCEIYANTPQWMLLKSLTHRDPSVQNHTFDNLQYREVESKVRTALKKIPTSQYPFAEYPVLQFGHLNRMKTSHRDRMQRINAMSEAQWSTFKKVLGLPEVLNRESFDFQVRAAIEIHDIGKFAKHDRVIAKNALQGLANSENKAQVLSAIEKRFPKSAEALYERMAQHLSQKLPTNYDKHHRFMTRLRKNDPEIATLVSDLEFLNEAGVRNFEAEGLDHEYSSYFWLFENLPEISFDLKHQLVAFSRGHNGPQVPKEYSGSDRVYWNRFEEATGEEYEKPFVGIAEYLQSLDREDQNRPLGGYRKITGELNFLPGLTPLQEIDNISAGTRVQANYSLELLRKNNPDVSNEDLNTIGELLFGKTLRQSDALDALSKDIIYVNQHDPETNTEIMTGQLKSPIDGIIQFDSVDDFFKRALPRYVRQWIEVRRELSGENNLSWGTGKGRYANLYMATDEATLLKIATDSGFEIKNPHPKANDRQRALQIFQQLSGDEKARPGREATEIDITILRSIYGIEGAKELPSGF